MLNPDCINVVEIDLFIPRVHKSTFFGFVQFDDPININLTQFNQNIAKKMYTKNVHQLPRFGANDF
jgi:hypothetical protein